MTIDFIAERTLRNTSRLVSHGMWLLFLIAAGLMMILRRSAPARTGSLWILGCAILAFLLSFALRDLVRRVAHRNTEDKILNDVKTFLEREPDPLVERPAPAKAAVSRTANPAGGNFAPPKSASFIQPKGAVAYRTPAGDPVVFDAFPSRESVAVRMDFYAALQPVLHNC
jgi:hypothetical protein